MAGAIRPFHYLQAEKRSGNERLTLKSKKIVAQSLNFISKNFGEKPLHFYRQPSSRKTVLFVINIQNDFYSSQCFICYAMSNKE